MSVELLDLDIANREQVVALRIDGGIDQLGVMTVLGAVSQVMGKHGKVRIYQEIINIGSVELDAVIEKVKFLLANSLGSFERVAIVTDKGWIQKIAALEGVVFRNIDIKAFDFDQRDQALDFIQAN